MSRVSKMSLINSILDIKLQNLPKKEFKEIQMISPESIEKVVEDLTKRDTMSILMNAHKEIEAIEEIE